MTHEHSHRDPACLEIFAKLSEYLDGEMADCDCRALEEHVAGCEPCVAFIHSLRQCIDVSHSFHGSEDCPPLDPATAEKLKAAWQAALKRRQSQHR